jgi:hypothetical protein
MNCIFSSQKMNLVIDSCILNQDDSSFSKQAAYITEGIYIKPSKIDGLSYYLVNIFLIEKGFFFFLFFIKKR